MFLDIARYDDDSRLDIIAAIKPQTIRVYCQPEEPAAAWEKTIDIAHLPGDQFGTVKAVRIIDPIVRRDGAAPPLIVTCENAHGEKAGVFIGGRGVFWQSISGPEGIKFDRIELLDLDGDGDLDVITCEETAGLGVVWYENPEAGDPARFRFNMGETF